MKTTLEIMLDNIAKKRYGSRYKYCTKKEQYQCLIYLDQDLKTMKEEKELDLHVRKCLGVVLTILLFGLVGLAFINFFTS